ncbi:(S)-2-hydroxy-acid oxidase [Kribbella flavida DSM 17836]|uniref:(S)-2-hydroxy-acid oxidase n=1 Tax=Kribbella flavida (strain DSM 17836 / JCM 10339 / NBRC 14399) TaxID=479435 RepID=D2PT03_KRIFD|nr:alpha-hydroxy acid oxidase [Kribbella flavida]ADB35055.1 (S)-2-hydroxy-acid oxidase [Kribbella flavida DSM 17836]
MGDGGGLATAPDPAAVGRGAAQACCLDDYERFAADVLPTPVRDFVAGGSGTETTLRDNRAALDSVHLTPRVMAGVEAADPSTRLVNTAAAMPVAVAPMAYQRLLHPDGELMLARAAASAGIPYVISTLSSYPLEEIAGAAPTWFQLYWLRDRAVVESLAERAAAAGCSALMVTVDVPVMGRRLRDVRNAFALPADVVAANLATKVHQAHTAVPGLSAVAAHTASAFSPTVSWADLEWLGARSDLPLVVKGILDPRDARRAVEVGATGIVVSNHGGRQLDGAVPSVDALPAVVDAVGNSAQLLLDSGIRSGTDVLRALALGASGVLVGRPLLWALSLGACDQALDLLRTEVSDAMMLAGCADVAAAARLDTRRACG